MGPAARRRASAAHRALAACLTLPAAAACSTDLQFTNDHRLEFTSPQARQEVTLPLAVRWTMSDFQAVGPDGSTAGDRGSFAVFVDQGPVPPGRSLRWIFRDDPGCKRDVQCPSPQYLLDRNIFVTTSTEVVLERFPQKPGEYDDGQHFVNVVVLDGSGRRIGESSWHLPFTYDRGDT